MEILRYGQVYGDWLAVGKLVRAHGIKGELKVLPYSGKAEDPALAGRLVLLDEAGAPDERYRVISSRPAGDLLLLRLEGVLDRNAADLLLGRELAVALGDLPPVGDGVYYWHQLVALPVRDESGRRYGRIREYLATAGHGILVLDGEDGEVLIPAVDQFILGIRPDDGALWVNLPPGLAEINS